jgi:hypothetical protein
VRAVSWQAVSLRRPTCPPRFACDASANATRYRFYTQRPILDPEPILAGSATEPLVAGQGYQIYISAINGGAESELSEPVNATPVLAAAA